MWDFAANPGYYFVLATLLPLVSFLLIFLASGAWCLARRYRESPTGAQLYQLFGGDKPGPLPAYLATAAIALAFVCSAVGFVQYTLQRAHDEHEKAAMERDIRDKQSLLAAAGAEVRKVVSQELKSAKDSLHNYEKGWDQYAKGTLFEVIRLRQAVKDPHGASITIGFKIDHLAGVMFCMVTFIATLIHLFSIGYMSEERQETVEDHHVHAAHGHLHRRGRFGRFFMYLSLFCFSMLNLILADNLFQVFVSWELVGVCSYLLIGFYYERTSASNAANKAFITNRVGDAGFIIGLLIVWGYFGTFNFEQVFAMVRSPLRDTHGELKLGGQIVRASPTGTKLDAPGMTELKVTMPGEPPGAQVVLFPRDQSGHFHGLGPRAATADKGHEPEVTAFASNAPDKDEYSSMPYWMLVAAGLGIFLGCVGKSAQFPLQVWLPDAMEGPTPVSALIHAATMVAAGVYLVGRTYPLFTLEVLLTIAYTGAITLFVAATIAIVQTDIKKVLAYSTVSQLGYMMLALGVGGWVAGLFHLVTHAFFKALLFLGSGSVIYGCHHEQEMTKMGGLYPKMKITAMTMFVGVLAIAGIPLFSGWYSKDAILAQAMGFVSVHRHHLLLFVLPLLTAGITTFYMFRMWFLTFSGEPRDPHVYEHAHESPWLMTAPLVILAFFSVVIAWGGPPWDATASQLEHTMHHAQHHSVLADFGHIIEEGPHKESFPEIAAKAQHQNERYQAHKLHDTAGLLALVLVLAGIVFAMAVYYYRALDPNEAKEQFPRVHAFLANKWYFDEVYSVLLVRPAMVVARAFKAIDLRGIDGVLHGVARGTVSTSKAHGRFDNGFIDYLVNLVGHVTRSAGAALRGAQTGYLRSYVVFLALGAVAVFLLMSYFMAKAAAG